MSELVDPRARLFEAIGWTPPPPLADEALTHRSFTNEAQGGGYAGTPRASAAPAAARNNQRLEVLGDAVLALCVSELLMAAHPDADEGALSRMRAALVRAEALAEYGRQVGLGEAIRLGRGASAAGDQKQKNVLADGVEALVGAAYQHGGLPLAKELVERVVCDGLARVDPRGLDPKSELQERVQARGTRAPSYRLAGAEGPENDRWFQVEVLIEDRVVAAGRGRSKKLAEQEAARLAIEAMAASAASAASAGLPAPSGSSTPPASQPPPGNGS
jgi:ribonuclease III